MNTKSSRVFFLLALGFTCALLFPNLVQACECTSAPTCSGVYCYCTCHFCSDQLPPKNPCNEESLEFNASLPELDLFKEKIDAWSGREELRTVVEAATELYNSVLFRDSQSFIEANAKFQEAISSLSEEARKSLTRSTPPQRQK